ncbi:MAG TPA: ATP-binding protein [Microlunatus sp.]|nr:ATP-binding protein [Microlunatus sp.]
MSAEVRVRDRRWSTRTRLIVTLAVTLTVILMITTTASILYMRSYVRAQIDDRLMGTSQRIRASLVGLQDVRMDASTVDNMAQAEAAAVVFERNDQPIMTANTDPATAQLLITAGIQDGQPHQVPDRPEMTVIRLDLTDTDLSLVARDGTVLVPDGLVIGFDTGTSLATVQRLILVAAGGVLAAIIALVAATVIIVSRSLRPLKTMSEQAHAFADGDRTSRLTVPGDDPEMRRLAETVNDAFDVQQRAEGRLRAFVADASHELRTPLTTATGWIELYLQGGLTDTEQRDQAMQRAMTQLGRMRVLIDELALLARLDRARPLDLDPVDLTALTTEVLDDARVINPDRRFSLHAAGPATLLGDAPKLQQVLQNLLGNAIQHTPPGTPVEVTVRPARPDAGGSGGAADSPVHTLLVTDHGPGISPEDQQHVFTRFWRGDASRNRQTGGVGLGLAIVSSIVTAHGGTSDVISQVGHGTTIRVRLPAAKA